MYTSAQQSTDCRPTQAQRHDTEMNMYAHQGGVLRCIAVLCDAAMRCSMRLPLDACTVCTQVQFYATQAAMCVLHCINACRICCKHAQASHYRDACLHVTSGDLAQFTGVRRDQCRQHAAVVSTATMLSAQQVAANQQTFVMMLVTVRVHSQQGSSSGDWS